MRVFVSIDPPAGIRRKLAGWVPDSPAVRKTEPGQIHLTLLFLGEQSESSTQGIIDILGRVRFEPFYLTITGLGAFPDTSNPSVIWAGVAFSPELTRLQNEIEYRLSEYVPDEKRTFKPHITLARAENMSSERRKKIFSQKHESIAFSVNGFSLKNSVLRAAGAEHEVLKIFH
jgi:2'-5' RNA ligase